VDAVKRHTPLVTVEAQLLKTHISIHPRGAVNIRDWLATHKTLQEQCLETAISRAGFQEDATGARRRQQQTRVIADRAVFEKGNKPICCLWRGDRSPSRTRLVAVVLPATDRCPHRWAYVPENVTITAITGCTKSGSRMMDQWFDGGTEPPRQRAHRKSAVHFYIKRTKPIATDLITSFRIPSSKGRDNSLIFTNEERRIGRNYVTATG